MKLFWPALIVASLTSGCGGLRQPALPKGTATAAVEAAPVDSAWTQKLRAADAIYFSLTKSGTATLRPAWQLVELLERGGERVVFGWAEIPANRQPLFEQWQAEEISPGQLLEQIVPPERSGWLREALRPNLGQLALGCAPDLLGKIRAGEALSPEERGQLPTGFHVRPDALENFTDRVVESARLRRYNLRRLYRAHLVAEETIADNIVRFRRDHPEAKLIIFLPNDLMIDPHEIADFAGQKMPLRQLILDRAAPLRETHPQLMADCRGRSLQVVNRAGRSGPDDRRARTPRLRA